MTASFAVSVIEAKLIDFQKAYENLESMAEHAADKENSHFYRMGWDSVRVEKVKSIYLMTKATLLRAELEFIEGALEAFK